eukprot:Gb_26472 [translate_table: standard]
MPSQMEKCAGIIPYVYNRIKGKGYRYQELEQEAEPHQRKRRIQRIKLRGSSSTVSWGARIPRRIKVLSPIRLLKSMKDAYLNIMFSAAAKSNVNCAVIGDRAVQAKGLPSSARWENDSDGPVLNGGL